LNERRKQAYRWLFYMAMLDIRQLQWISGSWRQRLNPYWWRDVSRRVKLAGNIAEWLHNLAIFSVLDFEHFDEERFWRDYQWLLDNNPSAELDYYRNEFEMRTA
jgi:hypothetical protein